MLNLTRSRLLLHLTSTRCQLARLVNRLLHVWKSDLLLLDVARRDGLCIIVTVVHYALGAVRRWSSHLELLLGLCALINFLLRDESIGCHAKRWPSLLLACPRADSL